MWWVQVASGLFPSVAKLRYSRVLSRANGGEAAVGLGERYTGRVGVAVQAIGEGSAGRAGDLGEKELRRERQRFKGRVPRVVSV